MVTPDPELEAMRRVLEILEPLDNHAQRRVVTWVQSRVATQEPPDPALVDRFSSDGAVDLSFREFLNRKRPKSMTDRLLCLVYWEESRGENGGVPISLLNDMNRRAGGAPFSDAGSIAQSAIRDKKYLVRVKPGHIALTGKGRDVVMALPT